MISDVPVVILAGGLGTRLREETDTDAEPVRAAADAGRGGDRRAGRL